MGIKVYKPISNARRQMSVDDFSDITKTTPEKSLIVIKKKFGGRNNNGRITVRHRGGGSKRYIRLVDFKRDKFDIPKELSDGIKDGTDDKELHIQEERRLFYVGITRARHRLYIINAKKILEEIKITHYCH